MRATFLASIIPLVIVGSLSVQAAESDPLRLVIKDHRFEPADLEVPAGQKFKLIVQNEDATPEEFESDSLRREKLIPAKGSIAVNLGPLSAGTYEYVGEFHRESAHGRLIAK